MELPSLKSNEFLKDHCTFGIGGPARYFIAVRTIEEMKQALAYCKNHQLRFFILGKGSNCLFDQRGFDGMVIANRIDFFEQPEEGLFRVGAGYSFSLLGTQTARKNWSGLEFASGIPGSVGGAVWMNAGANGFETCQTIHAVEFITEAGELRHFLRSEINFAYRTSSFQKMKGAIVSATFKLTPSPDARQKQIEIIQYRKKTQPLTEKSAGCIFRNPSCHHAGALIDQSGLKGQVVGGAQVSPIHANFLINKGDATSEDILNLIRLIQAQVKEKHEIELESEVRYIPYTFNQEAHE